ncbi:hypothetical protein [Pseudomonas aeruginosa]|uniref:hypothetical protein n=1 Tax=Pseudomonas aeruginosa TaxID=287 RepID=UPI0015C3D795|nr:hypothetical protein [Pseudomonas aeruginosa]QLF20641.1 hypothetical protein GNT46_08695 [Pseudomonas aeruginosa]
MEFVILVAVAVVAFFVGKATGKEAGTLESSKATSDGNEVIEERIRSFFSDHTAHSSISIKHMPYPNHNPLAVPLSVVRTSDLAHLAISYNIEVVNDDNDEEYAQECYKSMKKSFMTEIQGKYSESSVNYLEQNL